MPADTTNLPPETLDILRQVEELTQKPVELVPDPSLSVLAQIKPARGSAPAHVVVAKSSFSLIRPGRCLHLRAPLHSLLNAANAYQAGCSS